MVFYKWVVSICIPLHTLQEFHFSDSSPSFVNFFKLLMITIITEANPCFIVVLICILLLTNDIDMFLINPFHIYTFSFYTDFFFPNLTSWLLGRHLPDLSSINSIFFVPVSWRH